MTPPTPLSGAELARIAERAKKATKGPWREGTLNVWNDEEVRVVARTEDPMDPLTTGNVETHIGQRNAVFIAAARSDVPALLAHVAWQAERLAELEKGSVLTAEGITLNVKQLAGINGALAESLATEKAARVAAEGQAADLRTALGPEWTAYYASADPTSEKLTYLCDECKKGKDEGHALGCKRGRVFASPDRAAAAPDPATLTAMRELLWSVLTDVDDDFDGFSGVRNEILEFFGLDPNTEHWPVRGEMPNGTE